MRLFLAIVVVVTLNIGTIDGPLHFPDREGMAGPSRRLVAPPVQARRIGGIDPLLAAPAQFKQRSETVIADPITSVFASTGLAFAALNVSYTAQLLAGIAFREWLGNLPAAVSRTYSGATRDAGASSALGGGGSITADQFAALAQCESGGVNGWRTGYFGIESGNEGSKSYGEQVADVERILAQSGAHAWGVMCAPILGG